MIIWGLIFIIVGSILSHYYYKDNKKRKEMGEEKDPTTGMLMVRWIGIVGFGIMLILLKLNII